QLLRPAPAQAQAARSGLTPGPAHASRAPVFRSLPRVRGRVGVGPIRSNAVGRPDAVCQRPPATPTWPPRIRRTKPEPHHRMSSQVLRLYRRLEHRPFGKWLFSRLVCHKAPYFAGIAPRIVDLRPGRGEATIAHRRRVTNHLGTVHAIALCNLAEF